MLEIMKEYYESYKEEIRYELGDEVIPLSFEEYCDFYDITEETSLEEIYQIFSCFSN